MQKLWFLVVSSLAAVLSVEAYAATGRYLIDSAVTNYATTTPAGNRLGIRADLKGRAWFRSLEPGPRTFTAGSREKSADVPPRGKNALVPGFVNLPHVALQGAEE